MTNEEKKKEISKILNEINDLENKISDIDRKILKLKVGVSEHKLQVPKFRKIDNDFYKIKITVKIPDNSGYDDKIIIKKTINTSVLNKMIKKEIDFHQNEINELNSEIEKLTNKIVNL